MTIDVIGEQHADPLDAAHITGMTEALQLIIAKLEPGASASQTD